MHTDLARRHILLVTHFFPAHGGGIELVAGQLMQALAGGSFRLTWFAGDCDASPADRDNLQIEPVWCWNIIERRFGIPLPIWAPRGFYRLWKCVGTCDLVHIHDYLYPGNIAAFVFARLRGKPVMVTQHIGEIPFNNRFLRRLVGGLNRSLGRLMLGGADRVVFVSNTVRGYFSQFTTFKQTPTLIANGLDNMLFTPALPPTRSVLRERLHLAANQQLFLFVGRFVEKKGLHILHALATVFQQHHWVFVGRGPLDPTSWGLPNVTVFPLLTQTEIVPIYQAADLLVLPSKGEGFPLVVQESMACGTPAMVGVDTAGALPCLKDHVYSADAATGDAISSWSSALGNFVGQDGNTRAAMRQRVAQLAAEQWSWRQCAAEYKKCIDTLRSLNTHTQDNKN